MMSFETSAGEPRTAAGPSFGTSVQRVAPGAPVTPEGVVLDLDTAGVASRLLARALDLLLCSVGLYAVLIAVAVMSPPLWVMFVAVAIAAFLAVFVYPVVLEMMLRGRTVGKIATGLRVVTDIGAPIRFRHAATRSALSVVDLIATSGFAGIVAMILSPRHQRLGDLAAGTVVLRTRTATNAAESRSVTAPTGYESFVGSLDTSSLDPELIDLARTTLDRVAHWGRRPLERQLDRLAEHIDAELGGRRPARMPASTFLQSVVASEATSERPVRPLRRPRRLP